MAEMIWEKGITYIHEHVTIDLSGIKQDADARLDCFSETVAELQELKRLGVINLVDVTNRGMGRKPEYVLAAARQAGLNIICATGYYKEPFFPPEVYESTEQELAAIMIQELTEGMNGGEIPTRARLIGEVGSGQEGISPAEKKVMTAAAIAHRETGAPISTHTTLGRCGLDHIGLFQKHGVELNKVILGHIDLSGDAEYALRLIDKGVYIGFDTVGKINYQPESLRLAMLKAICSHGCADRVMLSMDITRKSHLKARNGLGYAYLLDSFAPYLLANGISQSDLDKMLIHNPAAFFAPPP